MTELENFKKHWKEARINESALRADSMMATRHLAKGNAASAKQALQRQFILSLIMGIIMILFVPLMAYIGFPQWLSAIYGIAGLIVICTSTYFIRRLRKTDFFAMPTVDALRGIICLTNKLKTIRIFRLCLALIVCGLLLVASMELQQEIFEGLSVGLIAGIILGFLRFRKQNRLLLTIKNELQMTLDSAEESDPKR